MAVKLEKTIKRELEMEGKTYTVQIAPEGIKVTEKGKRKGREISWPRISRCRSTRSAADLRLRRRRGRDLALS
jgi:hypothetical protein